MPADFSSPVVIGATGGSGTRMVRDLLLCADFWMGDHVNEAGDAIDCGIFLEEIINPILQHTRTLNYAIDALPPVLSDRIFRSLEEIITRFHQHAPASMRWGWKNPRSLYILPFLFRLCPEITFVHVIRDGRDIAFSKNQNQPTKHFAALFNMPLETVSMPEASIRLWDKVNQDTADWAKTHLGDRYIAVAFEELCLSPKTALPAFFQKLGIHGVDIGQVMQYIDQPKTIGRWQHQAPESINRLETLAGNALVRFGYSLASG